MAADKKNLSEALGIVARTATLNNIRLTGSTFEMKPEAVALCPSDLQHDLTAGVTECVFRPEHRTLFGACGFRMASQTAGGERVLEISGTYLISYQIDNDHGPAVFGGFLDEIGRPTIYPYFHALVTTATGQAGVLLGPLPVIGIRPIMVDR